MSRASLAPSAPKTQTAASRGVSEAEEARVLATAAHSSVETEDAVEMLLLLGVLPAPTRPSHCGERYRVCATLLRLLSRALCHRRTRQGSVKCDPGECAGRGPGSCTSCVSCTCTSLFFLPLSLFHSASPRRGTFIFACLLVQFIVQFAQVPFKGGRYRPERPTMCVLASSRLTREVNPREKAARVGQPAQCRTVPVSQNPTRACHNRFCR